MDEIIFICNANMCRSPMAEGILRNEIGRMDIDSIKVSSMGIHAHEDNRATEYAIEICRENAIDIEAHRSRPLLPDQLKESRLILTMEPVQVDFIDIFFPQVSDRTFMLGSWPVKKNRKKTIVDPVGRSIAVYRKTFKILREYIQHLAAEIV